MTLDDLVSGILDIKLQYDYVNRPTVYAVGYTDPMTEVLLAIAMGPPPPQPPGSPPEPPLLSKKFTISSGDYVLPQSGLFYSIDGEDIFVLSGS